MSNGQQTDFQYSPKHDLTSASASDLHRVSSIWIAGIYSSIGFIWIWLTDILLVWSGALSQSGFVLSACKGTFFVVLSTPLIYWLVRRGFSTIDRTNALLQTITDGTTDPIYVKDRDGKYLHINRAAARFVGKPTADVLGRDDKALFDRESASLIMERDRQLITSGQADTHEEILTVAGETRVYLATKAPFRDESGNVIGLIGISRDITDRKRAESAVREQELFARNVLDSITSHIAVLNSEGIIVAVNESWRNFVDLNPSLSGPAPRTGVGTSYLDVCDESTSIGCEEATTASTGIRLVIAGRANRFTFEYPCHSQDEERWFLMSVTRLDSLGGGVVVAHTNITERKQAEQLLQFQHSLLKSQSEASPDGILVVGSNNRIQSYNRRFLEVWGIPSDLITDGNDATFQAFARSRVSDPDGFAERVAAINSDPNVQTQDEVTLADGRTLDRYSGPIRGSNGDGLGRVWFFRDITDRKKAEQARSLLVAIVQSADEAIISADADGIIRSWNPAAERLFGYSPEETTGESIFELIVPPNRLDESRKRVEKVLQGERLSPLETVRLRKGGGAVQVSVTVSAVYLEGRVFGLSAIYQNITVRKRAEEDRNRFVALADSSQEFIGMCDQDFKPFYVNAAGLRLMGFESIEMACQVKVQDFFFPEDQGFITNEFFSRVQKEGNASVEIRFRHFQTGNAIWMDYNVFIIRDTEGALIGWATVSRNIDARKIAEQTLRDRERLLGIVTGSARVGLVVVDEQYRYLFANEAYSDIFGLGSSVIVGHKVADVLPAAWSQIQFRLDRALAGERVEYELTLSATSVAGLPRTIRVMYEPRVGDTEKPTVVVVVMEVTKQKIAEAAIRESEARFRNVFENAPTGIGITDPTGCFLQGNPAYRAVLGLSEDELRAADLAMLIHPDDRKENMVLLRQLAAGEIPRYELENRFLHKSGRPVWVHKIVSALRDEAGRTTHLMALVTDVTERRRADQELRASEERYRRLVDVLPAGVFVHNSTEIVFCNPAFVRLMGATHVDELLGRNPFDVPHPDYREFVRARVAAMYDSGEETTGVEIRVNRLDGRSILVESSATPISGYEPPAILVALTDRSERERSMELLRSVLGSVNDAILTINEYGTVQSANPATVRQFGYSETELIGRNINELMPEPYRSEHDGYIAKYLRTGKAQVIGIGREVEGRRKDGTTFPLELTVTEFRLDGQKHFTGVVRDITARRGLEAQFQQAQKMEAVGRLAGGVAHDFNNLLTVINGYSDLVLEALPVGDPQREFIAAIRESGDRAARLTQQLLAFSRKAVVEKKVLDLNELVAESAKLLRRLIGEDIALAVVQDQVPVRIYVDPGQLEQVVMNLVLNARDAMPTGGRLTIETGEININDENSHKFPGVKQGQYARLKVADTGHGMPDEVKNKIFEPFFTTKGVGKGTGLGLAVVHGVVELCGGHINVESKVGVGTTFTLLFPVAADVEEGPKSGVVRLAVRGTETILLVEDEDAVRNIARIALTMQGFTVLETGSGADAIRLAAEHSGPIHVLVTDVVMPEIGGRQLAEAVRNYRPDVRVLYMSGYTDDSVFHHGVESTDAFVQKPFTPLGLARNVRAVLDGSN